MGTSEQPANRDDPRFWKLGVFYANPDDPAVFVPKRLGMGLTFNFARPQAWLVLAALLVLPLLVVLALGILGRH